MIKIRSATRMALSIGVGCAALIWGAVALGLISDPAIERGNSRVTTARSLAVNVATFAENRSSIDLKKVLERAVANDANIKSVGVKRSKGDRYLMAFGPHAETWQPGNPNDTEKQIGVDILANGRAWGNLQIGFEPSSRNALAFAFPFGLALFVFGASSLFSWLILSRSLRYLNPSNVVPGRVRSALDTLAEGLVLLDGNGEIAHANESFYQISSSQEESLLGKDLSSLGWRKEGTDTLEGMPWDQCLENQQRVSRHVLSLKVDDDSSVKKFAVNATPILGGDQNVRGVLVSFDDVTAMENKNAELAKIIGSLRSSRDEVARQNERLNFLASYDPLTKCMNRRSFFIEFERLWASEDCPLLNLIMLDVDHFKNINDTHGHSVGDEVLVRFGHLLRNAIGDRGVVCRYGGEEFVVLVPGIDIDQCEKLANDLRQLIAQTEASGVKFTASLGLSCRDFIPMDAQHLLDQADESLYLAKGSGRNKVVRFDNRTEYKELIDKAAVAEAGQASQIPYSAVTGLLSALSFRCPNTAEHSIRVADMCVVVGEKLMNRRELYQLEVAALLHDIGKIGVPDAVLHKPGPLTEGEWVLMRKHDAIGAEIVRSALSSDRIAHFIESHHKEYSPTDGRDAVLTMPLASRVITACDAFDAMVNDRVYRSAMPVEDALAELERNAPGQFDPQVVSILCAHVRSGIHDPAKTVAPPVFSAKQATSIGQHIEDLYQAVSDEDVGRLKEVVNALREDASGNLQVNDVANKMDDAIEVSTADDLEKVLNLANEVMQICRDSRNTFVNNAESMIGKN